MEKEVTSLEYPYQWIESIESVVSSMQLIGEGQYSKVYKAIDTSGQTHAIKALEKKKLKNASRAYNEHHVIS